MGSELTQRTVAELLTPDRPAWSAPCNPHCSGPRSSCGHRVVRSPARRHPARDCAPGPLAPALDRPPRRHRGRPQHI
eukprot:7891532-Alexandrium_andersonii.AAC.1